MKKLLVFRGEIMVEQEVTTDDIVNRLQKELLPLVVGNENDLRVFCFEGVIPTELRRWLGARPAATEKKLPFGWMASGTPSIHPD